MTVFAPYLTGFVYYPPVDLFWPFMRQSEGQRIKEKRIKKQLDRDMANQEMAVTENIKNKRQRNKRWQE